MPYLGNEPAVAYTSTTKDSFSGDGSTTDFTMSKSANVNAVRVVVENVVQNPTVAYTCSGTTLSFTSAPPTGTSNIYVVHLGPPAATVAPPTTINNATTFTADLTVDTNTLYVDSTNNRVGLGTSSPSYKMTINTPDENHLRLENGSELGFMRVMDTGALDFWVHGDNSTDVMTFRNGSGAGLERMRIDSSGHVGIGTSSPNIANFGKALTITDSAGSNQIPAIELAYGSNTRGANIAVDNRASSKVLSITAVASDLSMSFGTNNTERMRIDSGGNVFIGKTVESATQDGFQFKQTGECVIGRGSNDTIFVFQDINTSGNTVGSIAITSSATSYNTSSDYRLKTDAQPMTGASARVQALNPVNFEWLSDGTRVDGFLAHEAQAVVPEAVHGTHNEVEVWADGDELPDGVSVGDNKLDDDGNTIPKMQGIDQSKLVPLLTAALQEAIAKIETLETKVAALEAG